ncbi:MAG: outer membrane protein assembly factor BamA [Treponema sp.]|jgi:outer membrane protein insertion porin family|nr:outer membrane protein assembly factor BamA [Treponema sp.]
MRRCFGLLFFILAVFPVFSQEGEWYQGKPVKDIVFRGLKHIKAADLEGIMAPFIGQPFSDELFLEIQGQLYALEYFSRIEPTAVPADDENREVIVRFDVTEQPVVARITFAGNSHIRRSELLDVVTLKVNDVVNPMKVRVDEQALVNKYLEKGYPDIKVRSEIQAANDGSYTVLFHIAEGEKLSIREFRFEGNSIFSDRTLRGQLTMKTKNLIRDGAFQEAKLAADRQALVQYYHDRGYIEADVTDVTREIVKDAKGGNNMIITFRIHEGGLFTFGGVSFEGNHIFPTEQLAKLVYSKPGTTANARRLEADLQRVADLYYENGYIFNTIERGEDKNQETGVVSYRISIVERGRAHIENIIVRGNTKTKTDVILREIPLEAGDVFSKTKVMDGMRNLYNLQYFSMVSPDTPFGSADNLMDLIFNVEEQPTTDVQFGLTFSGTSDPEAFPVSAMIKLNDRNLRGSGNSLGAEVNASPDTQSFSLFYTHRWIFGLPLSGGFDFTFSHTERLTAMNNTAPFFNGDEDYAFPDGFSSYTEYEDAAKIPPSAYLMKYQQYYISVGFSTGYRWSTLLGNLGLGGGIRTGFKVNTYDSNLYRPFDPTIRGNNNAPIPANSVWTSLSLDQRDIYYDPSRGYYGIQRFGIYGIVPMEPEKFIRTDTKAEYFHTLLNIPITEKYSFRIIGGLHTGLSFILPQPGQDMVHAELANQLAVDGMFVGRGWTGEYRNKGFVLWENWAEIRFPIVPGVLAWDFFLDAAAVKATPNAFFKEFSMDDMRYSLGGGIRFTIPQFPFRFGFAKRFRTINGALNWEEGSIGGLDFVLSFALSSY